MSRGSGLKATIYRIAHLPMMRIIIGTLVCGIAMLVSNSLLRTILGSEGDIVRIIRWILASLVLISSYYISLDILKHERLQSLSLNTYGAIAW